MSNVYWMGSLSVNKTNIVDFINKFNMFCIKYAIYIFIVIDTLQVKHF